MNESQLTRKVVAILKKMPGLWFYKAQDKWTSGIPDIIGCIKGQFIAIELKSKKGKVTKLQAHVLGKIREAGGVALVVKEK